MNYKKHFSFQYEVKVMSGKEARKIVRKDCDRCRSNLRVAESIGGKCLVNTCSRHLVAITWRNHNWFNGYGDLYLMKPSDAREFMPTECNICKKNVELAERLKWKCIMDFKSKHIVAIAP